MHIFIVYFNEITLDKVFLVLSAVDDCDYLVEASGNDAFEIINILLTFLFFAWTMSLHAIELDIDRLLLHIFPSSHYGVSLAASGLSIGKNSAIVAFKHVFNNGEGGVLIDVLLSGLR